MGEYFTEHNGRTIRVQEFEDCLESIKIRYESSQKRTNFLEQRLKEIEDEKWKDKELQEMKAQLDKMKENYWRGFPITEQQQQKINEWQKEHDIKTHHLDTPEKRMRAEGVSGGRLTYVFLPTSIGTFGTVKCSCGAEFDFQVAD
jgi:hydrogenase maturation factor